MIRVVPAIGAILATVGLVAFATPALADIGELQSMVASATHDVDASE